MSEDDDGPCTDCGDTGITYQTERRCSCQPPMNPSSEERVMRAREVLERWPGYEEQSWSERFAELDKRYRELQALLPAVIRKAAAFSDEGSGIGELREEPEAVAWLVEWRVNGEDWVDVHADEPRAVDQARAKGGVCTPLARLTTSPDIDRSGLAQEVE